MRINQGDFVVDTQANTVRLRVRPSRPELKRYVDLLATLMAGGPRALRAMLQCGVTADYFATDPLTGRKLSKVAEVLFCSIFTVGEPDHTELLHFAAASVGECVLPACRLADAVLAKKVVVKARAAGRMVPRAAVRTLVFRPDGIKPDEVTFIFPDQAAFAFEQLLDSGRFEAVHVAREAQRCPTCDAAAVFDALIARQEYDLAREIMPRVSRHDVRTETRVAYDLLQILSDSEHRLASELLFGISHGHRVL